MRHTTDRPELSPPRESANAGFGPSFDDGQRLYQVNPHAPPAFLVRHVLNDLHDLYAIARAEAERGDVPLTISLIADRLEQALAALGVAADGIERAESR